MCLYIGENQPKIAKRSIVCYKVVRAYNGLYYTSLMNYPITSYYNIKGYKFVDVNSDWILNYVFNSYGEQVILRGVIHTFQNLADAKSECDVKFHEHIFKCVIPKGTEYIKGDSLCSFNRIKSYGSKSIRFVEKIV